MKAFTIAFLTCILGQHSAAVEVKVHDKKSFVRSLNTVVEDEFCRNLEELELHMTNFLSNELEETLKESEEYDCECSKPSDEVLVIDCNVKFQWDDEDYEDNEQITFKANNEGVYELIQTSWGGDLSNYHDGSGPAEVFDFENGELDSCTATGCKSCFICDDKKSIFTFECGFLLDPDNTTTIECSDEYTGAYANTFDFGEIKTSGTTRHAVTTIFGSVLTTVLVTFLLV